MLTLWNINKKRYFVMTVWLLIKIEIDIGILNPGTMEKFWAFEIANSGLERDWHELLCFLSMEFDACVTKKTASISISKPIAHDADNYNCSFQIDNEDDAFVRGKVFDNSNQKTWRKV